MKSLENNDSTKSRAELSSKFIRTTKKQLKRLFNFKSKANILEEVLNELSSNKEGKFFKCEQLMSNIAYI